MTTVLRNSTTQQPSALASSYNNRPASGGGVHKGVWIGGGLMALTIVALATALVMKSGGSNETIAPLASTPTALAPLAAEPTAPAVVAQQAPVQAPAPVVAATPAPAPAVHHHAPARTAAPVHDTPVATRSGNTTVADAGNTAPAPAYSEPVHAAPAPCVTCGTIESYDAVTVQGSTNGIGAVGGGAVGAVLGSKIAGRNNHTLGGIVGAIGGGLLGNQIEKQQRTSTAYDVHVRMEDGSVRTVRQSAAPVVGQKVSVSGSTIQPRSSSNASGYSTPSYGNSNNGGGAPSNNGSSFSPSGN